MPVLPRRTGPFAPRRRRLRCAAGRSRLNCLLVLLVVAVGAAIAVVMVRPGIGTNLLTAEEIAVPPIAPPVSPSPSLSPPGPIPSVTTPPPVLRIPGPVPSAGRGTFGYDDRSGAVLGRVGTLRRYRVAVESGAEEDVRSFATVVQEALAGPGSWVDSGRLRLQQVPGRAPHDFTVYLVTAPTAGRMCAAGGVDIRVDGRPYTSCRAPGKVIINLDRWRTSVPHFVRAGVPLAVYRTYVVNHEVGHQLGHRHERCPGRGRPAPVMMQQTLFLRGCVANPWPYRDGERYTGPPL